MQFQLSDARHDRRTRWPYALTLEEFAAHFTLTTRGCTFLEVFRPINRVVDKRLLTAGIERLTPHDMRRSFISDLLDEGVELATVARRVGHSNVQTTARCDWRQERALRDATACLEVPIEGL